MANTKFNGYKVDERCLLSFKLDGVEPDKREDTMYIKTVNLFCIVLLELLKLYLFLNSAVILS